MKKKREPNRSSEMQRQSSLARWAKFPPLSERFWKRVKKTQNGCWLWLGSVNKEGYGHCGVKLKVMLSHRVAWGLVHGPIKDGLLCLHHCDNPSCVNPAHLFLGTDKDNAEDRARKNRGHRPTGEQNVKAKLTEAQVLAIRTLGAARMNQRLLAEHFRVGLTTIEEILARRTWKHV